MMSKNDFLNLGKANQIETILKKANPDATANYMAEITFDDTKSTRGMFETLCQDYLNGDETYRKALNDTVDTLLGMDFEALVDNVQDYMEEESLEMEERLD